MGMTIYIHGEVSEPYSGNAFAEGHAFKGGEYLDAAMLEDRLQSIESEEGFHKFVSSLEGYFSLILDIGGKICAGVDHCRSHPLFYTTDPVRIGNSSQAVVGDVKPADYDPISEREFMTASYVTGSDTLHPELKQVEAGTSITLTDSGATVYSYSDYYPVPKNYTEKEALTEFDNIMDDISQRVIEAADGGQICVSLSGGHDSRVMLCSLLKQGYDNVIALTFGREEDVDPSLAQEIATNLGVECVFVEYTPEMWKDLYGSDLWEEYYDRTFNLDSIPGLQVLPALKEVETDPRIEDGAFLVSGQTIGGVGSHLPPTPSSREQLIEYIYDEHYSIWPSSETLKSVLKERISSRLPNRSTDWTSEYANWEQRERQSKYLYQDCLAYDFFGYSYWYPMADRRLLEFFETLPEEYRRDKSLIEAYSVSLYSALAEIDPEDASKSESEMSIQTRTKKAIKNSRLRPYAQVLYRKYVQNPDRGDDGPLACYALLADGQYSRHTTGNETNHSFRTAEAVGRIDFRNITTNRMPKDSLIRAPFE
jgi:asparagine synthase (glutamine-hydrolysing)